GGLLSTSGNANGGIAGRRRFGPPVKKGLHRAAAHTTLAWPGTSRTVVNQCDRSMPFPDQVYPRAGAYVRGYRETIVRAWQTLDLDALDRAAALLGEAIHAGRVVYACGNGGSAAISGHLLCDFLKGIQTDTALRPKIISLASHLELITAIANDIAYE